MLIIVLLTTIHSMYWNYFIMFILYMHACMHAMPDQNQHTSWKSTCFRTDFLPNSRIWGYASKGKVTSCFLKVVSVCQSVWQMWTALILLQFPPSGLDFLIWVASLLPVCPWRCNLCWVQASCNFYNPLDYWEYFLWQL